MNLNRNQQLAAVAILGLALIGLSIGLLRPSFGGGDSRDVTITEPGESSKESVDISIDDRPGSLNPSASILVHVAGRVKFPNVYRIPPGSRVIDAIKQAGGALPDAYLDAINLAAKVKDGEQIYVPSRKTPQPAVRVSPSVSPPSQPKTISSAIPSSSGKLKVPGEGFVNINTADISELQRLPGVGPSTAQKIIDYRSQIGRFNSADQLMDVRGIGPKKLDKMRPFIVI
ncbi:MAG: helix-hairpin-helix domain-containing protein [Armatimonadota bacterium]|nr:helix-hairpin-helix domain-containing protein [Armatimonadota bacterium]